MWCAPAARMMLCMTFPTVTEIAVRLHAVEHDDFIDQFELPAPLAPVVPLVLAVAPATVLHVAA